LKSKNALYQLSLDHQHQHRIYDGAQVKTRAPAATFDGILSAGITCYFI
jgi:hypothetical protein